MGLAASASAQLTIIKASATPAQVDSNDSSSVEVGVKFRSDSNGYVSGLRFYKASTNRGTHIGHIWSKSGVLLGSATFTSETASGWQQVNFATPIPVSANTTYIASYFAPQGHYSADDNFFATNGIDSPPLHELAYGVDGPDGVYHYGSSSAFPSNYYAASNYWVDIVFTPQTTAATRQLTVSASTLAFGSVTVNSAVTKSLTLTSSGTSALTLSSAPITGAGFTLVGGSFPITLNPGQSTTLQVQFKPTSAASFTGRLTVNSNSSTGSAVAVALSGTGTTASNPQLSVSATTLAFGSVTLKSSTAKAVTLTSTGTSAVTVSSASITGTGFTILAGSFPVTLNPNQSVTLQIQFLPTTAGAVAGQLKITSNSTSGSTALVTLSGTGVAGNPQLTVNTKTLSFGSTALNTPITQAITLSSTGTSPVTVNSATITGAGFTTVGGSFPLTLNPSQTATLQVRFDPTTAGAVTGQLTIASNSTTGSPVLVALSGTGTSTAHSVDLSWTAPASSSDPVVGYNIYRALSGGSMQKINSSLVTQTTYVDNSVVSGSTYDYYTKSNDSKGVESAASNQIAVSIP